MKKILILMCVFIGFQAINAQTTTSNIKGTIKNSSNEILSEASILAVHTPTGTRYSTVSNSDGRFSMLNMKIGGPYKVTATFVGYQKQEISDVFLELGKTSALEFILVSESQSLNEVKITSKSKVFGSGRTGAETTIGRKELSVLPTISRSAEDFTRLEPSASGGSFGGRNDQYNNYSLNGAIFNNPFGLDAATPGGQTGAQPISLDAIDQIQVATAPYDVTLSGFTGASVNAVTKSGTNEFHGTAYSFFRNDGMTGSKVNGQEIVVPNLQQTQAGFSIGGPIIKDKLFFFANYEIDQRSDAGSNVVANDGNSTTGVNESRVLATDLMFVSTELAKLGYNTGSYQGFTHNSNSSKGIVKLDWNIADNHKFAFIYNFLDASKDKPAHPTAIRRRGPDFNTMQFANSGYEINNQINSFLVELNSKFTETISNKLQAGYTHFNDFRNPFSTPAPVISITKDGSPYIIAGHEPFSINNKLDQKVIQISDNLNIVEGNHTFTAGFSFEKFLFKNSFNLKGYGFDVFNSVDMTKFAENLLPGPPAIPGGPATPSYYAAAFASAQATFDARNKFEAGTNGGWNLSETTVGQLAFYVQDEWSINDDFKLTFGLRADKPLYFNTSELIQKFIDTDNSEGYLPGIKYYDPENGKEVNLNSTVLPGNALLWSPRVGFNWDVNGAKTTQLRGGTGIFTGRLPFVWIGNQVSGIDPFFYQVVDKDFKFPQVWRTSFGLDHKFEGDFILTVDMSYNKDLNAVHVQDWGLKTPTTNLTGVDTRPIYAASDKGVWTDFGFPADSHAYVLTNSNKGSAFNTSVKLQKTFTNGLYASVAYNYLKSMDVNSIEAEITGDAFNFNPALGNVNNDVLSNSKYGDTHRFIGVGSKKWKYGAGNKWATTISTFFEYAQGGRFNYTYGGDINNDGAFGNDLIYIPTTAEIATMNFSGAGQGAALDRFISQDDYLSGRRGQYAERYGALAPWRGKWDFKFLQDYNFKVGGAKKVNTIQFSIDVLNLGNLLNSEWGLVQAPISVQPIGVSVVNKVPTYTFNGDQTKTFSYDASLASRWQAQFGIRYIF
jgi:hypothetical protein